MSGYAFDDDLLRNFFSNQEQRDIFSAEARLQSWLDVEAALAGVQAEMGVIPEAAAAAIAAECDASKYDVAQLRSEIDASQHPIVPVVNHLTDRVGGDDGQFVHYGATTQDIMDTGQALQLRASLEAIRRDVAKAIDALIELVTTYRLTPMAGRTHGQHAVPITLGLKMAVWLDELTRIRTRIDEGHDRIVASQIFGAAGSMAAYGHNAYDMMKAVSERLGLSPAAGPWHASRDRMSELGSLMAALAGCAERIANEVILLQKTEVRELSEPLMPGHIGSSTMPQKRNPHLSEGIVVKSRIICGFSATLAFNTAHSHERDMSLWAAEWAVIPQLMATSGALAADLNVLVSGLAVYEDRMRDNLEITGGQVYAEGIMMANSPVMGRGHAHHRLVELTRESDRRGVSFSELVETDDQFADLMHTPAGDNALRPESYFYNIADITNAVVEAARES